MSYLDDLLLLKISDPMTVFPNRPILEFTNATVVDTGSKIQVTVAAGGTVTAVTGAAPITSTGGAAPQIGITAASGGAAGSMSSVDFTKLAGITAGAAVASVSGTSPIVSSGGTTPAISISPATGVVAGSMSAADFTKLGTVATGATNTPLATVAPVDVTRAAAVLGVSTRAAKEDHKHDITVAAGAANPPGTASATGVASSLSASDHTHALHPYGALVNTICQGNDSRLSDDRTASGLRSFSTIVGVSSAIAPTAGQVLTATAGNAANWQTPAGGNYRQSILLPITVDTTYAGAVFADLLSQSITLTAGGILLITVTASVSGSANTVSAGFRVLVDGTSQGGFNEDLRANGVASTAAFVYRKTGLSVGAHTVKVQWKISSGTIQCRPVTALDAESANLLLEEVAV